MSDELKLLNRDGTEVKVIFNNEEFVLKSGDESIPIKLMMDREDEAYSYFIIDNKTKKLRAYVIKDLETNLIDTISYPSKNNEDAYEAYKLKHNITNWKLLEQDEVTPVENPKDGKSYVLDTGGRVLLEVTAKHDQIGDYFLVSGNKLIACAVTLIAGGVDSIKNPSENDMSRFAEKNPDIAQAQGGNLEKPGNANSTATPAPTTSPSAGQAASNAPSEDFKLFHLNGAEMDFFPLSGEGHLLMVPTSFRLQSLFMNEVL